ALARGGVGPAEYWEGSEYLFEPRTIAKRMVSFGFAYPQWQTARFYEAPSIGRLPEHNAAFDPKSWRPRVPNQAFLHARSDDKFWAGRKLMALTIEHLRAAVRAGDFRDPKSEAFLLRALEDRRGAIGRACLTALTPIVEPARG